MRSGAHAILSNRALKRPEHRPGPNRAHRDEPRARRCRAPPRCAFAEDESGPPTGMRMRERVAECRNLYREHSPGLVRQLTRATGCRELARELANETFVRLLRMAPEKLGHIERPEAFPAPHLDQSAAQLGPGCCAQAAIAACSRTRVRPAARSGRSARIA